MKIDRYLKLSIALAAAGVTTMAAGQDSERGFDGYVGAWDYTVEGANPTPECGLMRAAGALHIVGRVDDRAAETYAAKLSGKMTWESCPNVVNHDQYAFVSVDGNSVRISYADPSWNPETLERDGRVMSGSDKGGVRSRWEKRDDPDLESRAVEVIANLIANIKIDMADVRRQLSERGVDQFDEAAFRRLVEDRNAPCVVESFKQYAQESGQPLSTVLNFVDPVTTMAMRRLYPESFSQSEYDSRFKECTQSLLDAFAQGE